MYCITLHNSVDMLVSHNEGRCCHLQTHPKCTCISRWDIITDKPKRESISSKPAIYTVCTIYTYIALVGQKLCNVTESGGCPGRRDHKPLLQSLHDRKKTCFSRTIGTLRNPSYPRRSPLAACPHHANMRILSHHANMRILEVEVHVRPFYASLGRA